MKEDLATLEEKVEKFTTDYEAYIDALEATKNYDCDSTESEFEAALSTARSKMEAIRKDIADIRSFYQNTIRPHILELKEQISENNAEEEEN